jgi:hypothetical protein
MQATRISQDGTLTPITDDQADAIMRDQYCTHWEETPDTEQYWYASGESIRFDYEEVGEG